MLNLDQIMFGFRSAYTLQHQDLMKQWMGIHMSATKVSLTTGVINVDFAASKRPIGLLDGKSRLG